jgi:hypothetical protein
MAKKKKKSKLKKLAKVLGAGLAIAGLGRAFANRNASPSTNADAIKAMTSNDAYSDDTMPSNLSKDMGMKRTRRDSVLASPVINKMDTSEVTIPDNYFKKPSKVIREPITFGTRSNDGLSYFKKGGRVGCGKAKRGFGRAMMKGKK